jgi:hypothetical protein
VPFGRVVKNGSNTRDRSSGAMPAPRSATASSMPPFAACARTVISPPGGVASTAFERSPTSTWQTRSPSALTTGSTVASSRARRTRFASSSAPASVTARATTSLMTVGRV